MATQLSYLEPQQTLHVRFFDHYVSKSFKKLCFISNFCQKLQSKNLLECNSFICSTDAPTDGPSSVVLSGVDVVTLGILYSFQCSASCYPACQFTWTWGNVTSQGPELSLQLTELQAAQNLTCTAVNPVTKTAAAAQKMLQAAGSDSEIQFDLRSCLSSNNFKQMFFYLQTFQPDLQTYRYVAQEFSLQELRTTSPARLSATPPATIYGELTSMA